MRFLCIGLLLAFSSAALHGQDLREGTQSTQRTWMRRATLAAGCAASLAFDTWATHRAIAAGAVETNPLFADSRGRPQWGRMIGFKAATCGIATVLQETQVLGTYRSPTTQWTFTAVNLTTAVVYTWAGFHNLKLANDLGTNSTGGPKLDR